MFGFVGELRSLTQGKGEYSMEYSRYAAVDPEVQDRLVEEYQIKTGAISDKDMAKKKKGRK